MGNPQADRDGRWEADPDIVKSALFPRRTDMTTDDVAAIIKDWAEQGLIVHYEVDGEWFMYFPKFKDHRVGMRFERGLPQPSPRPLMTE